MEVNKLGIDLIKQFEGLKLEAYPDPGSKDGNPFTIGYGHTGTEVKKGLVITNDKANRLLLEDLSKLEDSLERLNMTGLNSNQFSAIACLVYNIGIGQFKTSSLYMGITKGLKKEELALEFIRWHKNDGKLMAGLIKRRAAETILFLT